jgi:hypothetical protein
MRSSGFLQIQGYPTADDDGGLWHQEGTAELQVGKQRHARPENHTSCYFLLLGIVC